MDPITLTLFSVMALTSLASGGIGAYSAYQQGRAQNAMSDYNAKIAENDAIARQQAIASEQDQLTRAQRDMKAKQRMSIASRGGLAAGGDLLSLAEQAKQMQMDQLEMIRQSDLAQIRGFSEAAMSRYEGKQARYSSKWTAGGSLLDGVGGVAQAGMGYKLAKG